MGDPAKVRLDGHFEGYVAEVQDTSQFQEEGESATGEVRVRKVQSRKVVILTDGIPECDIDKIISRKVRVLIIAAD